MSPHIAELIAVAVQFHVTSGGTEPAKLRELLESICALAHLDGQLEGLNRIQAGFEPQELLKRVAA